MIHKFLKNEVLSLFIYKIFPYVLPAATFEFENPVTKTHRFC